MPSDCTETVAETPSLQRNHNQAELASLQAQQSNTNYSGDWSIDPNFFSFYLKSMQSTSELPLIVGHYQFKLGTQTRLSLSIFCC